LDQQTSLRKYWPLTIIGLVLAVVVIFFARSVHRQSAATPAVLENAGKAAHSPGLTSHPADPNSGPALDLQPRTWRPNPVDAYRNSARSGYAWILRQMGMSERDLDRLASGGFAALLQDLAKDADRGDQSAILSLGWLARRCYLSRNEEQLNSYQQSQSQGARLLPPADSAWLTSFLNQDIDTEKQHATECALIDQDHVEKLLTELSRQGNGASTFMLAEQANNVADANLLAREAALQGFPQAQYEWGLDLLNGKGYFQGQAGDPSAVDFLRNAADQLPSARAALAVCEFHGCGDEDPDPQRAIGDARMAAQQGEPSAMMNLAATAPPSLISAAEAKAWALFDVALQQRGCRTSIVGVSWMKSMAAQSANATPQAQALADQDWQLYGASAMQNLGC
jgi:hypothetical protein